MNYVVDIMLEAESDVFLQKFAAEGIGLANSTLSREGYLGILIDGAIILDFALNLIPLYLSD